MPDFLKIHSITFYIELLSSKYVGVGVNFALLTKISLVTPIFIRFSKSYIKVYGIKKNFEIVNARLKKKNTP